MFLEINNGFSQTESKIWDQISTTPKTLMVLVEFLTDLWLGISIFSPSV